MSRREYYDEDKKHRYRVNRPDDGSTLVVHGYRRTGGTWQWPDQSLTFFAELTNVLDRQNVGGIEHDVEEDEDSGALLITPQPETLLPFVPSLGVRWRF